MGVWTEPLAQTRPGSAGLSWRDRRKGRERREGSGLADPRPAQAGPSPSLRIEEPREGQFLPARKVFYDVRTS